MRIVEFDKNKMSKEKTTLQCVAVADSTSFPTNYDDVYAHLFETNDLLKLFVVDNNYNIKGFAVFDTVNNDYRITYLSGMVLSGDIQGIGLSKELLRKGLESLKGDIITLRTRNPRMYRSLIKSMPSFANFPNLITPNEIYELAQTIPYFMDIQQNLIIKNCYGTELLQQEAKLNGLDPLFKMLEPKDAFGCLSVVSNNEKTKKLIKEKAILK